MVNDNNDKWSDNGELPINPEISSNQLVDEHPKRKALKNQINDQKEMSMEELMKGSKGKKESTKNMTSTSTKLSDNAYIKEESIKNMKDVSTRSNTKVYTENGSIKDTTNALTQSNIKTNTKEEPIKELTKNDKSKEMVNIKIEEMSVPKDLPYVIQKEDTTKETPSEEKPIKEVLSTLSKEQPIKEVLPKEYQTKEILSNDDQKLKEDATKETLSNDNQKLKDQLKKLKEEVKELHYIKDISKYIKNLDSSIAQLAEGMKTFTDAKSWEAISRGKLEVRRYANYYDVHNTIKVAGLLDPNDFDGKIYNIEKIYEALERYAEIIYVTNDGTENLYVIVSHGGRTRFSTEAVIYPGEIKFYLNIYEIRLRSPAAGLKYRVTEYRISIISETSKIPVEKVSLHDEHLPEKDEDWLYEDITPSIFPATFRIQVAVSIAGIFRAAIINDGKVQIVDFNVTSGPELIEDGLYVFELLVHRGDSINFQYSETGGNIKVLRVQEVDAATA